MQAVDVLRDDRGQLALLLQLRELVMRAVGLGVQGDHALAVKVVELLRVGLKETMPEHLLGRVFEVLVVKSVFAAEIRDAAGGRHARAAEKDDAAGAADLALELGGCLGGVGDRLGHGSSFT